MDPQISGSGVRKLSSIAFTSARMHACMHVYRPEKKSPGAILKGPSERSRSVDRPTRGPPGSLLKIYNYSAIAGQSLHDDQRELLKACPGPQACTCMYIQIFFLIQEL